MTFVFTARFCARYRRAGFSGLSLLFAASVLAGCGNAASEGPSQVVASVNGEEVTESQVNRLLERQSNLKPDQLESASRQAVASLVEQEIVLRKARELKLDRDQRVVQDVEAVKREIITAAYLNRIAEGAAKSSPKDIQAYYDANPALFAERRVYSFQELSVQADESQKKEIESKLTGMKSPSELEAFLQGRQIPVKSSRTTVAAENLPLMLLQRVVELKPGQGLIMPAAGELRILMLLGSQNGPLTEEQVRPAINAYLQNQSRRAAVAQEVASLRASSKVEYFGKYADLAASAPAPANAGSAPGNAGSAPSGVDPVRSGAAAPETVDLASTNRK